MTCRTRRSPALTRIASLDPVRATVTGARFRRFVDREVTPDFPEGLTVQEAGGGGATRAG